VDKSRIALLNDLLFSNSKKDDSLKHGVSLALRANIELKDDEELVKALTNLYNSDTKSEFLNLDGEYFDPLFVLERIQNTAKRLAGYDKAILVIYGLSASSLDGKKRKSFKSLTRYSENLMFVESCIERYKDSLKNLDIIFL